MAVIPKNKAFAAYYNVNCRDYIINIEGYTGEDIEVPNTECYEHIVPILTEPDGTPSNPTASLTIDNQTGNISNSITAQYSTTTYSSHTVKVTASDIASYTLMLSGPATLSGPSAISATAGAKGSALANDTWGYAWEATNVTDANANYKALGNNINLTGDDVVNNSVNFTRKLAFAAKFQNAQSGTYHADINLSLVATPKAATSLGYVSWNRLVYMQDMNPTACAEAPLGTPKTLTDIRDDSTYTVAKLADGKCWMTQNLRLSDDTIKTYSSIVDSAARKLTLTSADSNVGTGTLEITGNGYKIPPSATWPKPSDTNDYKTTEGAYYDNDTDYGAYYSYYTATAGTTGGMTTGTADWDICPKGWRLPTGGSGGEFYALANVYPKGDLNGSTNKTGWTNSGIGGKSGRWFGATNATGGAFFPAAGCVNGSLIYSGSDGDYWPSTIFDNTTSYRLYFGSSSVNAASYNYRYVGYSVRCVAK